MALAGEWMEKLAGGGCDAILTNLYGNQRVADQRRRYVDAIQQFVAQYGGHRPLTLYSTPGRTELGGNHTDHNNGCVMAASIDLDIIAVVAKNDDGKARVCSQGFAGIDEVETADLAPSEAEFGRSSGMIRGVAAGIVQRGGSVGGFDAFTTSDVLKGSGLSSSAAFEVCMGSIFNGEYNDGRFSPVELSLIGQYAENVFFGKPSGLMDQLACAVGGAITIDFADPQNPLVCQVPFDLASFGRRLVITDTKGDHADLTADYAAVRTEMESVAACFGKKVLRQVDEAQLLDNIPMVREKCGDRAVLRALHYYAENRRVPMLAAALQNRDIETFEKLIIEGGHSSFEYNQNAYTPGAVKHQALALGLALSQRVLGQKGAWRLQGGGFAGTIQAFVPDETLAAYRLLLQRAFGDDACHVLSVRAVGCTQVQAD